MAVVAEVGGTTSFPAGAADDEVVEARRASAELAGEKNLGRAGQFRLDVLCRLLSF